jgi:hypothetical protein
MSMETLIHGHAGAVKQQTKDAVVQFRGTSSKFTARLNLLEGVAIVVCNMRCSNEG